MKTLTFKTNINCSSCVARVTPALTNMAGVKEWKVDTNTLEKVLEVKTENLNDTDIIKKLDTIGFKAETKK